MTLYDDVVKQIDSCILNVLAGSSCTPIDICRRLDSFLSSYRISLASICWRFNELQKGKLIYCNCVEGNVYESFFALLYRDTDLPLFYLDDDKIENMIVSEDLPILNYPSEVINYVSIDGDYFVLHLHEQPLKIIIQQMEDTVDPLAEPEQNVDEDDVPVDATTNFSTTQAGENGAEIASSVDVEEQPQHTSAEIADASKENEAYSPTTLPELRTMDEASVTEARCATADDVQSPSPIDDDAESNLNSDESDATAIQDDGSSLGSDADLQIDTTDADRCMEPDGMEEQCISATEDINCGFESVDCAASNDNGATENRIADQIDGIAVERTDFFDNAVDYAAVDTADNAPPDASILLEDIVDPARDYVTDDSVPFENNTGEITDENKDEKEEDTLFVDASADEVMHENDTEVEEVEPLAGTDADDETADNDVDSICNAEGEESLNEEPDGLIEEDEDEDIDSELDEMMASSDIFDYDIDEDDEDIQQDEDIDYSTEVVDYTERDLDEQVDDEYVESLDGGSAQSADDAEEEDEDAAFPTEEVISAAAGIVEAIADGIMEEDMIAAKADDRENAVPEQDIAGEDSDDSDDEDAEEYVLPAFDLTPYASEEQVFEHEAVSLRVATDNAIGVEEDEAEECPGDDKSASVSPTATEDRTAFPVTDNEVSHVQTVVDDAPIDNNASSAATYDPIEDGMQFDEDDEQIVAPRGDADTTPLSHIGVEETEHKTDDVAETIPEEDVIIAEESTTEQQAADDGLSLRENTDQEEGNRQDAVDIDGDTPVIWDDVYDAVVDRTPTHAVDTTSSFDDEDDYDEDTSAPTPQFTAPMGAADVADLASDEEQVDDRRKAALRLLGLWHDPAAQQPTEEVEEVALDEATAAEEDEPIEEEPSAEDRFAFSPVHRPQTELEVYLHEVENEQAFSYKSRLVGVFQDTATPHYEEEDEEGMAAVKPITTFTEFREEMRKKGFTVKQYVSESTYQYYSHNYINTNKIKFATSILTYLVALIMVVLGYFVGDQYANLGLKVYIAVAAALLVVPGFYGICYICYKERHAPANFSFKLSMVTSVIAALLLMMVFLLLAFFIPSTNANISQVSTLVGPVFYPMFMLTLLPISVVIYALLYRSKRFHV